MPSVEEQVGLAERTMTALVADADMPPKIAIHPRPPGSFIHAMPAAYRGPSPDGSEDLLGMKWVGGFVANVKRGLPRIHAVVVLNDASTGVPSAILDGRPITTLRTAAVSGVAIRHFAPAVSGRPVRAAIIGSGVQAGSHLAMLGHVVPGVEVGVFDRHPERAEAFAPAGAGTAGIGAIRAAATVREAIDGADIVVTVVSFGPDRQAMKADWLAADALVVAVDYEMMCSAEIAASAALFLVDDRDQFLANRDAGRFEGYPDPGGTLGQAILDGSQHPGRGHVVVTHLGVGLADVIFGDAIVARAAELGIGTLLPR